MAEVTLNDAGVCIGLSRWESNPMRSDLAKELVLEQNRTALKDSLFHAEYNFHVALQECVSKGEGNEEVLFLLEVLRGILARFVLDIQPVRTRSN